MKSEETKEMLGDVIALIVLQTKLLTAVIQNKPAQTYEQAVKAHEEVAGITNPMNAILAKYGWEV